jgi:hypothetical protein
MHNLHFLFLILPFYLSRHKSVPRLIGGGRVGEWRGGGWRSETVIKGSWWASSSSLIGPTLNKIVLKLNFPLSSNVRRDCKQPPASTPKRRKKGGIIHHNYRDTDTGFVLWISFVTKPQLVPWSMPYQALSSRDSNSSRFHCGGKKTMTTVKSIAWVNRRPNSFGPSDSPVIISVGEPSIQERSFSARRSTCRRAMLEPRDVNGPGRREPVFGEA